MESTHLNVSGAVVKNFSTHTVDRSYGHLTELTDPAKITVSIFCCTFFFFSSLSLVPHRTEVCWRHCLARIPADCSTCLGSSEYTYIRAYMSWKYMHVCCKMASQLVQQQQQYHGSVLCHRGQRHVADSHGELFRFLDNTSKQARHVIASRLHFCFIIKIVPWPVSCMVEECFFPSLVFRLPFLQARSFRAHAADGCMYSVHKKERERERRCTQEAHGG